MAGPQAGNVIPEQPTPKEAKKQEGRTLQQANVAVGLPYSPCARALAQVGAVPAVTTPERPTVSGLLEGGCPWGQLAGTKVLGVSYPGAGGQACHLVVS